MPAVIATARGLLDRLSRTRTGVLPAAAQYEVPALSNLGLGLLWSARTDEAEPYLLAADSASRDLRIELTFVNTLGYRPLLAFERGDLESARSMAIEGLELAERRGWTELVQAIVIHLVLALVHIERSELPEARRRLDAGLAAQRNDPESGAFFALKAAEARLLLVSGQLDRARGALVEHPPAGRGQKPPALVRRWQAVVDAEIELALGRPSAARDRLRSMIGQDGTGAERVSACMARVQLALGDAQRAEAILPSLRASDDCLVAVDAWLTSALVASRARADHLTLTSLDSALALAERHGIRRPFVIGRGPRLDAMLRHRSQLDDGRFIAGLLGDAGPADRPARPRTPPGATHRPGADRAQPPGHAADADRDRRPAPHLRQHAEDAHPVGAPQARRDQATRRRR